MVLESAANIIQSAEEKIQELHQQNAENVRQKNRRSIQRNRRAAHQQLMQDYFDEHATFQGYYFHRQFCMHKKLFEHIVNDVIEACPYL